MPLLHPEGLRVEEGKAVYNGDATYAASQSTIISVLVR